MKKVSIILPTYNVAQYLDRCISSLQNQTYPDIEFLFINDGTPDNSVEIIEKYAENDGRIKCYSKKNGGAADSRNYGLQFVTGAYIMFLDPDDWLELTAVADLVAILEQKNADMAVGRYKRVYEQKQSFAEKLYKFQRGLNISPNGDTLATNPRILIDMYPAPWGKIYKKAIFDDEEVRFPVGYWFDDLIFTSKFLHKFGKMVFLDKEIINYAIRPGSYMTTNDSRIFDMFDLMDMVLDYYRNYNIFEQYYSELESFYIQHVLIGMSYRVIVSKTIDNKTGFTKIIEKCRERFPNFMQNKYLKNEPMLVKVYVSMLVKQPKFIAAIATPFFK